MAAVVRLQPNEHPPTDVQYVLVDQDTSRGFTGLIDFMLHGSGATFYVLAPYGERERTAAIEQATAWADSNGIANVYVASLR